MVTIPHQLHHPKATFFSCCLGLVGGEEVCPSSSWSVDVSMEGSSGVTLLFSTGAGMVVWPELDMDPVEAERPLATGLSSSSFCDGRDGGWRGFCTDNEKKCEPTAP